MIIAVAIIAFLAGALAGALILWRVLPGRLKHHADYRQRWEDAVGLLGTQGQLTAEQVTQITAPGGEIRPPRSAAEPAAPPKPAPRDVAPSAATLRTLHRMATWDRAELEIARAEQGLAPIDDLDGMATWDKKVVLAARAAAGTG